MFHPQGPSFWELARQSLSSTESGYDQLASKFDYTPFRTPDFVFQAVHKHLEPLGPFDSMLDVCCGTGGAIQAFEDLIRKRLVGVDFSQGMLKVARKNLVGMDQKQRDLEWVHRNALAMDFDNEFDLAVTFGSQGHILPKDERVFCERIFRSLRSGGRFVFVTSCRPPVTSSAWWLAKGFNAAMRIRNWVVKPPFIMYYLTFLWPDIEPLLTNVGFTVSDYPLLPGVPKTERLRLVIAEKI